MSADFEDCPDCAADAEGMERARALAAADPALRAEPARAWPEALARVQAEIARREAAHHRRRVFLPVGLAASLAAGALAARLLVTGDVRPRMGTVGPPQAAVSAEALLRMERTVGREQAVRYLQSAEDVLLSVSSTLPHCDPSARRRAVGIEAARSRALLADRRLLVDVDADPLAGARPVIEDVDMALGEVAALDPCAKASDVQAIAARIVRERLLMKMDVLARELQG
jgi:hypothetical protein